MATVTGLPIYNYVIQLTNFGGSANWNSCRSDDGDTTYVYISGAGPTTAVLSPVTYRDLYIRDGAEPANQGTISNLRVGVKCRAVGSVGVTTVASCIPKLQILDAATEYGASQNITTSYAVYTQDWATNPATGIAWTWEKVHLAIPGVSLTQGFSQVWVPSGGKDPGYYTYQTHEVRCTYVYLEVTYTPAATASAARLINATIPFSPVTSAPAGT